MASRIEAGYRRRFRLLLARLGVESDVEALLREAHERARGERISLARALELVYEQTRAQLGARPPDLGQPPRFLCDANLGALARWLRAAGYEARFRAGIDDAALVAEARSTGDVLLSADIGIFERRLVRDGLVRSLWVPGSLRRFEQLALVLRELGLSPRAPRCMACGGRLERTEKQAVSDRIPPRTARWRDDYSLCASCGRLYWHGTHWERIASRLEGARAS